MLLFSLQKIYFIHADSPEYILTDGFEENSAIHM